MQLASSARWFEPRWGKRLRLIGNRVLARLRPAEKRVRLRESLSLGEKRLLAVVVFDGRELLLAVTQSTVSVLAEVAQREPCVGASRDGGRL